MLHLDTDLLELIGNNVPLLRMANTNGGEYAGPCPFCAGLDRFRVWPNHPSGRGRYWCRICSAQGDAIDYVRQRDHIGFSEACKRLDVVNGLQRSMVSRRALEPVSETPPPLHPPSEKWQAQARSFVETAREALWSDAGGIALNWLHGRGLNNKTISAAGLGFNVEDQRQSGSCWGLCEGKFVWLPAGIVIPWQIDGEVWRVNIRRLVGVPKYIGPAGNSNGLYGAGALKEGQRPVVLVEGEFDKLALEQDARGAVAVVAAGSTSGARKPRWIGLLAQARLVLISFDADEAGEKASRYWLDILPSARRWRPYWNDLNDMLQDGASLAAWLEGGLER